MGLCSHCYLGLEMLCHPCLSGSLRHWLLCASSTHGVNAVSLILPLVLATYLEEVNVMVLPSWDTG